MTDQFDSSLIKYINSENICNNILKCFINQSQALSRGDFCQYTFTPHNDIQSSNEENNN